MTKTISGHKGDPTTYTANEHNTGYVTTVSEHDGMLWVSMPDDVHDWVPMGVCPVPKSGWQTFKYHVLHGLIMGYPLASVLKYAWRNRDSFE